MTKNLLASVAAVVLMSGISSRSWCADTRNPTPS
jgi:hypothetical protein